MKMRPELPAALYKGLIDQHFHFIRCGDLQLQDVYKAVKKEFPELCDDNVFCSDICSHGKPEPEWHHRVRAALQALKSRYVGVTKLSEHGWWRFAATV
jgi:hypothetical protein